MPYEGLYWHSSQIPIVDRPSTRYCYQCQKVRVLLSEYFVKHICTRQAQLKAPFLVLIGENAHHSIAPA